MKPLGPIPAPYAAQQGELCIAGQRAADLAAAHGTPLFVYDSQAVRARVAALRAALPARVALHYAVKANPFGPLVALMAGLVDGFDIASGGELALLQAQGIDPVRAGFAGPGKRDATCRPRLPPGSRSIANPRARWSARSPLRKGSTGGPGWPFASIPISTCADRG